jgi:hypothetical protein
MNLVRSDASAAAPNGRLHVAEEFYERVVLPTVKWYSLEMNNWTVIDDMINPRAAVQAAAHSDAFLCLCIPYVFEGATGFQKLSTGEVYDPFERTWTLLPVQVSIPRSNFSLIS